MRVTEGLTVWKVEEYDSDWMCGNIRILEYVLLGYIQFNTCMRKIKKAPCLS